MSEQYWAALPIDEVGAELVSKVTAYDMYLQTSGIMTELKKSYKQYYGNTAIESVGEVGELQAINVNQYRSLIQSILVMVTSQRPAWEPRASNTDVKSQSQCILAEALLEFIMRDKRVDRDLRTATETAIFLREGWVAVEWETQSGEVYAVSDAGLPIYEGDVRVSTYKLNDVIRDAEKNDSDHEWLIVRSYRNRYDMMAKYPDLADKIRGLSPERADLERFRIHLPPKAMSDQIAVHTFYHRKSPAIPQGRIVEFLAADVITLDGPLPYRKVPVFRISPSNQQETAFGTSQTLDLLPINESLNMLYSTALSNNQAFGVQNIMVPKGSDLSITELAGGMNLVEYDKQGGKPEPMQMTATAPETYNFMGRLEGLAETISGVSQISRGNAPASMSGAAMALLQSTSIQYASGLSAAYTALLEDVGTQILHVLADFANTPRVANIVGKNGHGMLKSFKGDDISNVARVTVDSGNALTKTAAGCVEIANQLLANGMIENPQQYIMVLTTGKLQPVYENQQRQLLLIRSENESLQEGKTAIALATDQHAEHILEHASVLSSPEARSDANAPIVVNTLAHIQQHIELLKSVDPALLGLLKQQPIQAPPPPAPVGIPEVMNPANPVSEQAMEVAMPSMPVNPATGERAPQ